VELFHTVHNQFVFYLYSYRGIRIFQIQRWNFEHDIGRYWQRGLRSYLRNETDFYAIEGRIWGCSMKWRPYPRDQGKFVAIRDGTNLTEVFGRRSGFVPIHEEEEDVSAAGLSVSGKIGGYATPWEERFHHAMTLPFYQAHPDQLERIEDNFDMYYRNLLGRKIR